MLFQMAFVFSVTIRACIFAVVDHNFRDKTCYDSFTCDFSVMRDIPPCYCDTDCLYYTDCCKEYLLNLNVSSFPLTSDLVITETCEQLVSNAISLEKVGAFMITKCGLEDCEYSRETFSKFVPVSTTTKTYRNANCAQCNGVHSFEYWHVHFEILKIDLSWLMNHSGSVNNFLNESLSRRFIFHPPREFIPRFCYPQFASINVKREAPLYQAPIFSFLCLNSFRNIEQCSVQECCEPHALQRCQLLTLPEYPEKNEIEASKNLRMKHLQVLILPPQGNNAIEGNKVPSLKFRYKMLWVLIPMRVFNNTNCYKCSEDEKEQKKANDISRFFRAISFVIGGAKYKLVAHQLSFSTAERITPPNSTLKHIILTGMVTQTVPLSPEDLRLMMEWTVSFRSYDSKTGFKSAGKIELADENVVKYTIPTRLHTESNLKLKSMAYTESCSSISLHIDNKNLVTIECTESVGDAMNGHNSSSLVSRFLMNSSLIGLIIICLRCISI